MWWLLLEFSEVFFVSNLKMGSTPSKLEYEIFIFGIYNFINLKYLILNFKQKMLIYLPIILNYQKNQFINTNILCKTDVTIHLVGERAFQHMSDSGLSTYE